MKKTYLHLLLVIFIINPLFGQKNASDSLQDKISNSLQDKSETAALHKEFGMALYQENQMLKSYDAFQKASDLFGSLNDVQNQAECFHMMGNVSYFLGKADEYIPITPTSRKIERLVAKVDGL
jgi:hypothetical protein